MELDLRRVKNHAGWLTCSSGATICWRQARFAFKSFVYACHFFLRLLRSCAMLGSARSVVVPCMPVLSNLLYTTGPCIYVPCDSASRPHHGAECANRAKLLRQGGVCQGGIRARTLSSMLWPSRDTFCGRLRRVGRWGSWIRDSRRVCRGV